MAKEEEPKFRKLYRSGKNRMVSGVCGGIAEFFAIDPTIVRLAFVLFALCGPGLFLYIVAWLIVPVNPEK